MTIPAPVPRPDAATAAGRPGPEPAEPDLARFAGHSPGPWEIDEEDGSIRTPDGFLVGHVAHHGNINTVARTGSEFNAADLRLLAAGPELLARLSAAADARQAEIVGRLEQAAESAASGRRGKRLIGRVTANTLMYAASLACSPDPAEGREGSGGR